MALCSLTVPDQDDVQAQNWRGLEGVGGVLGWIDALGDRDNSRCMCMHDTYMHVAPQAVSHAQTPFLGVRVPN
jgi:hypothetical protein